MAASAKPIPFAVPAQPQAVPATITQQELGYLLEMRRQRDALAEQIEHAEARVKAALAAGAQVQAGIFRAWLKTIERRSVAWKAVVERELGEAYAARVLASTKPDTYTQLVVAA